MVDISSQERKKKKKDSFGRHGAAPGNQEVGNSSGQGFIK
jgi:hypothetical protein